MSEHKVTLTWNRGGAPFEYQKYPRNHTWKFDGGHEMTATAAPAYLGDPKNTDPEEAFVASLSSCHMLTFLAIACKQKFVLDEYEDNAVGHMEKNAEGRLAITKVKLHPKLKFSGDKQPTAEELDKWCRDQLAVYKVPKSYEFRESLPKTVIGKVLRRQLRDETLAAQRAESEQSQQEKPA